MRKKGTILKALSYVRIYVRLVLPWLKAMRHAKDFADSRKEHGSRVLIVPCEPWSGNGSRGDEAMLLATEQQVQRRWPGVGVDLLVDLHCRGDDELRELGFNVCKEWAEPFVPWCKKALPRYRAVYILGADVTDGAYGWWTAYMLLRYYDIFSRAGIEAHYLGFSWSKTPHPMMHLCFPLLRKALPLPVRDPASLARVTRFTKHRPLVQVADSAFMLELRYSARVQDIIPWIEAQKKSGRIVVAVNVHQMFNGGVAKGEDWERSFVEVLNRVQAACPKVIYLLVPHDNRPKISDDEILTRIATQLTEARKIESVWHADEVKAVLGACDALIAGRMHVSIGALGQGVPVLGLVYQGKFEGLWQLLGLDEKTYMQPDLFVTDAQSAYEKVVAFVEGLAAIRNILAQHLREVKKLSALNYKEVS